MKSSQFSGCKKTGINSLSMVIFCCSSNNNQISMLRISTLGGRYNFVISAVSLLFATGRGSPSLKHALCYNDDGQVALNDTACNSNLKESMCCRRYWTCLNNGLCSNQNTTELDDFPTSLARATCTDRTWESQQCPRFCLNGNHRYHGVDETTLT